MTLLLYATIALAIWIALICASCICSDDPDALAMQSLFGVALAVFWPGVLVVGLLAAIPVAAYYINRTIRKRLKP